MKFAKKQQLYRIDLPKGSLSERSMPDILDAFAKSAFEPIDDTGETSGSGFVSALDEDRNVKDDGISFGSVWLVGHRRDTRKADRKAAQVLLNREIRKGAAYDRKGKKERLQAILEEMTAKAVPIPSTQIIVLDPSGDRVFVQAPRQKKAEEIFDEISRALDMTWSNVVFCEDGEQENIRAFLEDLWIRSEEGRGPSFEPKSVSCDECVTTSGDSADLAFGRVNGKKCSSGILELESGVSVDLKDETLHSMKIALNLDNAPEDDGEALGFMAQAFIEAFDEVDSLYNSFKSAGSGDVSAAFERQARKILN